VYASRYLRISDPLMEGIDVRNVQERLKELGYYNGDITSIYDKETAEAVRNFQLANGLIGDGIVGPITWNAIGLSAESLEYFDTQYNITVDLSKRELILKEGEQILKTYPVAVGKPSTPTPVGNWRIIQKTVNPGGAFGARWMRLNISWGGYGIHGTNDPESIGKAVSHGCVRMYNEDVIELYDIVPLGTEVNILGSVFTGRILYLGVENGSDIAQLQEILRRIGYYNGSIDGIYGEGTRNAVMDFQRDYGLIADGVVGVNTYDALEKANDTLLNDMQP
jgi:L,D-transpeptidase ErfK/SrfK